MNNHLLISFFINDSNENNSNSYHVFGGPMIVEALKNSTKPLEELWKMGMEVLSLQTNMGTIVVKPLETSSHRLAKFELLVFIFTLVMFICTVLLCLAIICSCAKRKSVDMNQIQLNNANRRQTSTINGFDLNSASNILRDEIHEKRNHNVINLEDGWVAPIDNVIDKCGNYDMGMEVLSLQTNMGTIVVKPLETSSHRLAKFELLVFIFTLVMFICTVLLCLAIICSCAKRKSVDMNQIQLNNANRRQTATINGFDLNSASNILRDEIHEKRNHNVINLEDGWVAPIDNVIENEKITKYDNLQDTKL
ncbi:unnamed protein product [Oppiella nova]|uniref:Uncharacterized protein n=1 Tax=Oppiella nova TaxID=334625 RepID=A0A7R9QXE0_9ACAR|nr:unnamed protein product [Oppiella nova]CAG2177586.1 unnamed protein product [Oppiella nova]